MHFLRDYFYFRIYVFIKTGYPIYYLVIFTAHYYIKNGILACKI